MKNVFRFLIISAFLLTSCVQNNDKLPDTYIARFKYDKAKFEELISLLAQDTAIQHKLIESLKPKQFSDVMSQKLKDLEIHEVWLLAWRGDHRQIDFVTSWRRETPIHVYYNTWDSTMTKNSYYNKDENSNEIWGLGNFWCLWNEVKLRTQVQ
jgi:hypothetical protein